MTQVAELPVELASDSNFAMPYGQHYRKDDDGLPWQVDTRGGQESGLRKFIEEQVAEKTPATTIQVGPHQFRVYHADGQWRAKGVVDGQLHRFSASDRDQVIAKLMPFAQRNVIRNLSPSEEIEVARLCQTGQRGEGIARYLRYRIGEERGESYNRPEEMTADPELQSVFSDCAIFCWLNSRPDVRDSTEFQDFLAEYVRTTMGAARPINFDVLDAAWVAFGPYQERQATKAAIAESRLVEREPSLDEVRRGIEDLDDQSVQKLFWNTARHVARASR